MGGFVLQLAEEEGELVEEFLGLLGFRFREVQQLILELFEGGTLFLFSFEGSLEVVEKRSDCVPICLQLSVEFVEVSHAYHNNPAHEEEGDRRGD